MKWEKREDLKEKGEGALLFTSSLPGGTCLPSIPWLIAMMIVPNGLERDPGLPELPGLLSCFCSGQWQSSTNIDRNWQNDVCRSSLAWMHACTLRHNHHDLQNLIGHD